MTTFNEIEYEVVTYENTSAGQGIRCDNIEIYCDSESYYCDGSVVYSKTEHSNVTYEDIEYVSGGGIDYDGNWGDRYEEGWGSDYEDDWL